MVCEYFENSKRIRGKRMHPPYMGLFQTYLFEMYFQSRRLFLGMDVISSFTTRDVFVALMSESTVRNLSPLSMNRKRELLTDRTGWVDFPSWQLTLHSHSSDVHANCLPANCEFALHWSESFWSWETKSLMHAINHPSTNIQFWVNSSRHMYTLGTYFSLRQDK